MTIYYPELSTERPGWLGSEKWVLRDLNQITVLFGRNGSGKSILLRSLRAFDPDTRHYVAPERGGSFALDTGMTQGELSGSGRAAATTENLAPTFRNRAISRVQAFFTARGAYREDPIPVHPDEIEEMMGRLLPDFRLKIMHGNPLYTLTRAIDNTGVTDNTPLSSGESEVFGLGIDLVTVCAIWKLEARQQRLLLIDEPDTHLHPDLQQHLANFIVTLSKRYDAQIIVATHSTTLLSALGYYGGDNTSVLYLTLGAPEYRAVTFDDTLQELAACLGGHALMGPLFGAPILLVEGDDDYKIWSQVPRHHHVRLAVMACSGGEEMRRFQRALERLFASIRTPSSREAGYALLDGDKGLPQPSSDFPQAHVRYIQLNCHESENLYLTNEVLKDIGTDWESAKLAIQQHSSEYGQKSGQLQWADSWDPQRADLKQVIAEIADIVDPKKLPWTLRVGKCIGKGKPTGQLAEFLGPAVMDALWK